MKRKPNLSGRAILCSIALFAFVANAEPISGASPEQVAQQVLSQTTIMPTSAANVLGAAAISASKKVLGTPFNTFLMNVRQLSNNMTDDAIQTLQTPLDERIFPVLEGKQVVSSITVHKREKSWVFASITGPTSINLFVATRNVAMQSDKLPATAFRLVRIPQLNMIFLTAKTRDGQKFWSPIDIPEASIAANVAFSGHELISKLAPLAALQQ